MTRNQHLRHLRTFPKFTMLCNYCELCQSPLYIDANDSKFCTHCDWFEEAKKEVSA